MLSLLKSIPTCAQLQNIDPTAFLTIFVALFSTFHILGRKCAARMVVFLFLCLVWELMYDTQTKMASILSALTFAVLEFTWNACTTEGPDGNITFTPFAVTCRPGRTTWAQFWVNVLFSPLALYGYEAYVSNDVARHLLYPLNIWTLEAIQGYTLIFLCGQNIAWTYTGPDAVCHNNIKLGYALHWWILGALIEYKGRALLTGLSVQLMNQTAITPCHLVILACFLTMVSHRANLCLKGLFK